MVVSRRIHRYYELRLNVLGAYGSGITLHGWYKDSAAIHIAFTFVRHELPSNELREEPLNHLQSDR